MEQKPSILIVEDDLSFALELEMLIEEISYTVIAKVDNSAEALQVAQSQVPDLILMDIDINGEMNGIEVGMALKDLNIPILYITSYGTTAHFEQAKETNLVGYLVKPLNKYSVRSAINLALESIALKNEVASVSKNAFSAKKYLLLKKKKVYVKVLIADLIYIKGSGDYSSLHTATDEFISSAKLKELEELLVDASFLKVHRSYIINTNKVTSISLADHTIFFGEIAIPFSRQMKTELTNKFRFVK